jgi:hypothetical protein
MSSLRFGLSMTACLFACRSESAPDSRPDSPSPVALPAGPVPSNAPAKPIGAPLLSIEHLDNDDDFAELRLAPHIRCDGGAVLVPLETLYGGEHDPVSAAIIDRAGGRTVLDLDALVPGEFDARDVAAVRRKLADANARLATGCWRPLVAQDAGEHVHWRAPELTVSHAGTSVRVSRPDAVIARDPDDDCPPRDQVTGLYVDDAARLAAVRIDHVMHDNCGGLPPSWIVVALR